MRNTYTVCPLYEFIALSDFLFAAYTPHIMSTRDEEARQVAPIAIVGMACRLPGNVSTLDDFWTMVSRSRDAWSPVPKERFSSDAFYHPNPQKGGCFNQRGGYFLQHDYSKFDAPFFQMTRQEAIAMGGLSFSSMCPTSHALMRSRSTTTAASGVHI